MAAASCLLTEDQFLCSICLDVFADPVSIPCGHNFCKNCITHHWNLSVQCLCPVCKRIFSMRPELQINTFISEMVAQFRQSAQHKTSSSSELIEPVQSPEDSMCKKHNKQLELFCRTDQVCICVFCTIEDHKAHDVVSLKDEYKGKKAKLGETEAEVQWMIQERQQKIEEIKQSVELSNKDADREVDEGLQVLTALKESVQRCQDELSQTIKQKQAIKKKRAGVLITQLEQEIADLKKRISEVEQLSRSEDHLHLIRTFSLVRIPPSAKDWTTVTFLPASYEGTVVRAVSQLESTISTVTSKLFQAELSRVQKYAVNVTLDPDVVHPERAESKHRTEKDGKRCRCVLSKRGFTSGRFYFSVPTLSTCTLGVAIKLTNISSETTLSPRNGYWTVCMEWKLIGPNKYFAAADQPVCLSLKSKPSKIGLFVDYEQGLVSFLDVDTAALIYSFTDCSFPGTIYPFFSPCNNNGMKIHSKDEGCVIQ